MYQTAPGWASVVLAISFFSGVQLLTLGIMGEYVARLYSEAQKRPLYFVSEKTGGYPGHRNDLEIEAAHPVMRRRA